MGIPWLERSHRGLSNGMSSIDFRDGSDMAVHEEGPVQGNWWVTRLQAWCKSEAKRVGVEMRHMCDEDEGGCRVYIVGVLGHRPRCPVGQVVKRRLMVENTMWFTAFVPLHAC